MKFEGAGSFEHDSYGGRNLHFGIREHAMGAAVNGLALSNLRPYGSTFLIFSDYMKPPIRLSAILEVVEKTGLGPIVDAEFQHDYWQVEAYRGKGKRKLRVDAISGKILSERVDD